MLGETQIPEVGEEGEKKEEDRQKRWDEDMEEWLGARVIEVRRSRALKKHRFEAG